MKIHLLIFTLLISATAFAGDQPRVLSMQEREAVIDRLLEDRLKTTLPVLMRREGFDMWIVMSREYKEVRIMLEEDAYFDQTGVHYIDGRQTDFILIDAQKGESS